MTEVRPLATWHRELAQLIEALGTDRFFPKLVQAIACEVDIDYPQVWHYHREHSPQALYFEVPPGDEINQIDRYIAGSYRLDPFYQAAFDQSEPGVYRLTEIAAARFEQSEYFKSYYALLDAADEIVFMVDIDADSVLQVCLMRSQTSPRFTAAQLAFLRSIEPPVRELIKRQLQLTPPQPDSTPSMEQSVTRAFGLFGRSLLTGRERDVLGLILQGYSSKVAAERLGISLETLRRHRKNIYRKLDVCSQNELFSLFLSSLQCLDQAPNADPLISYMQAREAHS